MVAVLTGGFVFAADLVRAIELPLAVEFLGVQSYGDATRSSGIVRGFTIPDVFVVGYGLDAAQLHRNLRDVRVL